jgi:SAM-dependent methyltransferase
MTETARYEDITETTGTPVTPEAVDMMSTRYNVAASLSGQRRVLELGCGAGQGLGLISAKARMTVGGDYSAALLASAKRHYGTRIPFVQLSAEVLPFRSGAFDVVFFFEATYYIPNMAAAFAEIARVLAPGGTVLFVNANPERPDFIRSPFSTHYHSAGEFVAALTANGFDASVEGAFPVDNPASGRRLVPPGATKWIRQVLERLHLVPATLKGRARLKRLIYGKLTLMPAELTLGFGNVAPRSALAAEASGFKVLYVTGKKR